VLRDLGLTEGEIRVYLALLELGSSTAGKIIEKSRISPSKIYNVLDRLIEKGIVSYVIEGKTRNFKPAPPRNILNYIERKEEELKRNKSEFEKVIPLLETKRQGAKRRFTAEIFEGINGLITVFDMSLHELGRGDIFYSFGYPAYASELFDTYWRSYYKQCDRKGILRKVIFDYDAWFLKKRTGRKLSYYRYLPKGIVTPSCVFIFNDKVATVIITPEQKVCFLVQNKEVSNSYLAYFDLLWKNAKAP